MNIYTDCVQIHAQSQAWRSNKLRVALVPTMGNLHAGHMTLIKQAKAHADHVIVSIYVNALQFNQQDDYDNYPRTLSADLEKLESLEVEAVFTPSEQALYPHGLQQAPRIYMPGLADEFCGKYRPGHFEGVCTVVTKLFNITVPHVAIFGKKDYQQLLIIERLSKELCLDIEIIAGETVRENDGLAMSSRNNHLNDEQRAVAPSLHATLQRVTEEFSVEAIDKLETQAKNTLDKQGFRVEYLSIRDADTLQEASQKTSKFVVLAAAWLGSIRLIDNIVFP